MSETTHSTQEVMRRAEQAYAPPVWAAPAAGVCLALGVVGFALGLLLAPGRAWATLLVNFLFWTGVAQASVVVAAVFNVAPARWGKVVQRIALGLSAFLPFSLLLYPLLWLPSVVAGLQTEPHLPWLHAEAHHPWLDPGGMFARDLLILAAMTALSGWFVTLSLRRDVGLVRGGDVNWLTRGWRGDAAERERIGRLLPTLSVALILGYTFGYSVLAIDLSMTLPPHFYSTMFPVIYFIGQFLAALALTTVLVAFWRRAAGLEDLLTPELSLDLGNLTWGFTMFSGYVLWGQYMAFWMANLPREALWILVRYRTFPWGIVAWIGLLLGFAIPFLVLFNRPVKRNPAALAVVGGAAALGILLQRFLDVFPFVPALGPTTFGLVEAAITLGFVGWVALAYLWLMRRVPLFPVTDPLFFQALAVRHVEV